MAGDPPRLIAWFVGRALPSTLREAVLGDLAEQFRRHAAVAGRLAATRQYCRDAVGAVRSLGALSNEPTDLTPPRGPFDGLGVDLRFALRLHARRPAVATMIVATLGLALGGSTALFSVLKPALLEALPYPNGPRLVSVWEHDESGNSNLGFATIEDLATRSATLDRVAAIRQWQPSWLGREEPLRLEGQRVSHTFFAMLGVVPAIGRDFNSEDDRPGSGPVVIVSHRLWRERLAADPAVVGTAIALDGSPTTIIGVLPDGFESLLAPQAQIWGPLRYDRSLEYACRSCRHLRAVGRLAPGQSLAAAQGDVATIFESLRTAFPKEYPSGRTPPTLLLEPLKTTITKATRTALWLLFGAMALVLGVACTNVANVLLGQAVERRHEFGVRMALGSGKGRLVRQVLIEAMLLGVAGAVVALGLVALANEWIRTWSSGLPRAHAIGLDWSVFAFGALVGIGVGIGFGLLPARMSVEGAGQGLRLGGRVTSRRGVRQTLVTAEVALASVLVIGTLLLVRGMERLLAVDPGFRSERLVVASIKTGGPAFRTDTATWNYFETVRAAAQQLPGVESVGLVSQLPLSGDFDYYGLRAESRLQVNPDDAVSAARYAVSPGYLETMGIALLEGRTFGAADRAGAPLVAIVNEQYAKTQFPGRSVLGERVGIGGSPSGVPIWRTVVGVVGNVKQQGLDDPDGPQVYLPYDQWQWGDDLWLVVRARGGQVSLGTAIQAAVRAVHPDPTIERVLPMTAIAGELLAARRRVLDLFAAFGGLALVLAAVGVYGVMASSVSERSRELGIRAAIGASSVALRRSILAESVALSGGGIAIGGVGALLLARWLGAELYGFRAGDPIGYLTAALVLIGVTVLAAWIPASRAARQDPAVTLRAE